MKDIFPITIDIRRNPYFSPRLIGCCGSCLSVNQSNHAADGEKKDIYVVVSLLIMIEYIYLMMAKKAICKCCRSCRIMSNHPLDEKDVFGTQW